MFDLKDLPPVKAEVTTVADKLRADPRIVKCLEDLKRDEAKTVADQIAITEVEAPPFHEKDPRRRLDAPLQGTGPHRRHDGQRSNVIAVRPGTLKGEGPHLVLAAHQDTVFPAVPM